MADSLSHEYGHHYTFYHMFPGFTREQQYLDSEYFRLRGLIRKPWRYSPKTTISTTKTTTVSCLKSQRRTTSC